MLNGLDIKTVHIVLNIISLEQVLHNVLLANSSMTVMRVKRFITIIHIYVMTNVYGPIYG